MILPTPDASFEWQEHAGLPALVCRPLSEVARHLFTTRQWRLGTLAGSDLQDAGWEQVASVLGLEASRLVRVTQVHGVDVAVVRDGLATRGEADVPIAADSSSALAVRVADCVPLLFADGRTGVVAAAHAGWRGLAAGVPAVAVRTLEREFGSRPADLVVAAGPSVGACCYEVRESVLQAFIDRGFTRDQRDMWLSELPVTSAANPSMSELRLGAIDGRWFFDGWACTRDQLIAAGVPAGNIFTAATCTASHPGALCSYRRDGASAGRLVGAIRAGSRT